VPPAHYSLRPPLRSQPAAHRVRARRKARRSRAPPVTVLAMEPQQVPLTASFTGRLSAYREANVLVRVSGVLLKRLYKEGTEAEAGQPLFEIDPTPYKTALDAAAPRWRRQGRRNQRARHRTARPRTSSCGVGQHDIGTCVVGGMFTVAVLGVLLIPVSYAVMRRLLGDALDEPDRSEISLPPAMNL